MEDRTTDDVESEEISEAFTCCVCLDLLYKPIVLSCGHISCFWCVHRSMNRRCESRCPICRHPYNHFPSICQIFHFLLLKMYPVAYKRRENQILEVEKKTGFFSPQFDAHVCGSHSSQELNHLGDLVHSSTTISQSNLRSNPWSNRKEGPCANIEQSESVSMFQDNDTAIPQQSCNGNFEGIKSVAVEEQNVPQNNPNGNCKQVAIADLLCAACKQLLFRPAVLNCGHVYCEICIINLPDDMRRCQVCQTLHPSGFPKVCLELDHFLEEQFPKEYELRRDAVQLKRVHLQHESSTECSTKAGKQGASWSSVPIGQLISWWHDYGSKFHFGVGCDSCGMFPIIGDRYKCKDCVEAIGFDLCGDCYNTRSKLPGRFNQKHTPEHKFEQVKYYA